MTDSAASGNEAVSVPLGICIAVRDALCGREIDYYPQVRDNGVKTPLSTHAMMKEFGAASAHWSTISDEGLDEAIKLARQSLDEVKEQTEYQDQKATRLLTVTTFLTALAGVIFTRLNDAYPAQTMWSQPWWAIVLLAIAYFLFAGFLFTSLCGALVTFHATRTRFKYVEDTEVARDTGDPTSRLFYRGILSVRPMAWSTAFVPAAAGRADTVQLRPDLRQSFLRDLVGETYLVASKTADKLRYLDPAQRLLATSLKCLIGWLILLPFVVVLVPSPASKPSIVQLALPDQPLPIAARIAGPIVIAPIPKSPATSSGVPATLPGVPKPAGARPEPK
jgi:hypothetical protein